MKKKPSTLDQEIARIESLLKGCDIDTKEYTRTLHHLERLHELNQANKPKFNISGDTLVMAGVNLLGILLILQHENLHAVSSKALGFVSKLRL